MAAVHARFELVTDLWPTGLRAAKYHDLSGQREYARFQRLKPRVEVGCRRDDLTRRGFERSRYSGDLGCGE